MTESSPHFERERSRLIAEIAEATKCVTSANALNRNIENVASVSSGFEPVHALWNQFQTVMLNGSVGNHETTRTEPPILAPHFPSGVDGHAILPHGLAPGQGETALLQSTH
ncbi:BQ5605_C010g05964 [Microbotryum silenes-dioicae]|uniref:DASH complex subunit DAD1 n=1 Tax=Microbotryum silenes-dioicae TaxID=796604 RepID=A0A2X0MJE2_9BASI|nr:BQ5605_C010g05964 [Microbotryum silenes-dioicae]